MDKAEGWLRAQGWKKGQGLGRHGQGMATHVKVALKKNTHGVGAVGNEWGDDWWDKMYDSTLSSLDIEQEKGKVKVNSTSGANSNLEVSIQKHRAQQYKGLLYGHFTKSREPLLNLLDSQTAREAAEDAETEDNVGIHTPGVGLGASQSTSTEKKKKSNGKKDIGTSDGDTDSDSDSDSESEGAKMRAAQLHDCIHHLNSDKTFKACNSRVLRKYVPVGKLQRIAMQDAAFANGSAADGVISMTIANGAAPTARKSGSKRKRSEVRGDSASGKKRRTSESSGGVSGEKAAKRAQREREKEDKKAKRKEEKKETKRLAKVERKKVEKAEKKRLRKEEKERASNESSKDAVTKSKRKSKKKAK